LDKRSRNQGDGEVIAMEASVISLLHEQI
jgi:hypothetical protein